MKKLLKNINFLLAFKGNSFYKRMYENLTYNCRYNAIVLALAKSNKASDAEKVI